MSMKRNYQFDILKGLGILLVVFGHLLSNRVFLMEGQPTLIIDILYAIIFSFHMPLLIFISGYFTRDKYQRGDIYYKKAISSYIIPFIIMNFVLTVSSSSFTLQSFTNFLYPKYTLWYLLSLFFWKIMIVPFSQLKHPLLVSILLSLFIGFTNIDSFLSIHRTIAFFPIFILGTMFDEERINRLKEKVPFIVGLLGIVVCVLIASFTCYKGIPSSIYHLNKAYYSYGNQVMYCALRGYALMIGTIMTLALIIVVPNNENILSKLGRNSMPLYLVHGFIIIAMKKVFTAYKIFSSIQFLGISLLITIILALLFGNKYVQKYYSSFINLISSMLIK